MAENATEGSSDRRGRVLLAGGALLGIALAASGALEATEEALPSGAVARVNHRVLWDDEYQRTLERLASDKRNPLSDSDRVHVLDRLIEEELLIQRGVEIGLVDSDRSVRKAIAAAMIQSILADVSSERPDDADLEAFFVENHAFFTPPARLWVRRIVFRGGEAAGASARAIEATLALESGAGFEEVRERFGDTDLAPVPDALLPPHKLREYLGPTLVQQALEMRPGSASPPLSTPSGPQILQLVELEPARKPTLANVQAQVESEYRRRAGDRALRDSLDWLRDAADVALSPKAPTQAK